MDFDLERCITHPFEHAPRLCVNCGHAFCEECLVYPRGPRKDPICVSCAVAAAGLRQLAAMPPARSRKEAKRINREKAKQPAPPPLPDAFVPYEYHEADEAPQEAAPERRGLLGRRSRRTATV